jgi:4-hydroxybenzoyl-CoA reductase subunit beta
MIRLPPFELLSPMTVSELTRMLADCDGQTTILAGGTDLIVNIKQGLATPRRVVWLGQLGELRGIRVSPRGELRLGAMSTLSQIAASAHIRAVLPCLADTALAIASPAIRSRATLGGNLCQQTRCNFYDQSQFWRGSLGGCLKLALEGRQQICHVAPGRAQCSAVFGSDAAPLLIALEASVRLISAAGQRVIALHELYRDAGCSHLTLQRGEIVAEVIVPPQTNCRSIQKKIRSRQSVDFPLVTVGVSLTPAGGRVCRSARIVLGAIQSAPIAATSAEALLAGNELTAKRIEEAAEAAASCVKPLPNAGASVGYRKRMVAVLLRRAITELAG